jgi:hypothetical protein
LKKLVIALALASVSVGLAACGGGDGGNTGGGGASDESQVRAVIDLGNSKSPDICERLTDRWMKNVVGGDRADCEEQVKNTEKDAIQVKDVSVAGSKATVTAQIQGEPGQLFLVEQDGEWKLDDIQQQSE